MNRNSTIPQSAPLTAPFTQGGLVIGITGGTGCGKTTLLNCIAQAGGLVLDCDAVYHQLLKTDKSLLDAIEARFPGSVRDGALDRRGLAALVFTDKEALQDLNRITHGAVKAEVVRRMAGGPDLVAIDAIALFESGLADLCRVTVAVTAPRDARIARLVRRDGITEDEALRRIRAQRSDGEFAEKCDYVLENDGTAEQFQGKCLAFLKELGII